jgi:hypothetical protein
MPSATEGQTIVVAVVDPGETSGIFVAYIHPDLTRTSDPDLSLRFTGKRQELRWDEWMAWRKLVREADIVVCENFRLFGEKARHLTNSELLTVRLIGALQCLCALSNKQFETQEPAILGTCTDKRLRKLGLWHTSPHIRSASKHALWFLGGLKREINDGRFTR